MLGKKLPPRERIGESWELCDRPEAQSVIANGPLAGKTLGWLWEKHRREIFGEIRSATRRFPLLIKWLDCVTPLSLQVHPDRKAARRWGGEEKGEGWFVIAASRNAKILAGVRAGVTGESFHRALATDSVKGQMRSFVPRAGDAIYIPAGCLHAAQASVFLEIQQNSDTAFRVSDWDRGRPLQILEGLACANFRGRSPSVRRSRGGQRGRLLVACPHFMMRRVTFAEAWRPPENFCVVCIVKGGGWIRWCNGRERFRVGDCWLLPAWVDGCRFEPRKKTAAVVVRMPKV